MQYSLKYSLTFIVLHFGVFACSRPSDCIGVKCANSVKPAVAPDATVGDKKENNPSDKLSQDTTSQNGEGANQPKSLAGFEAYMALQAMVAGVESEVILLDETHFENMRSSIRDLSKIGEKLDEAVSGVTLQLNQAKGNYQIEGLKLLDALKLFKEDRKQVRLNKMRQLEQLEKAILDPLTPEGLEAQVRWDSFFAKLDVVRELSVKEEIMKVRDEMLKSVAGSLGSDKAALTGLVNTIIETNLALVDASAPANAERILSRLIELETELNLTGSAEKTPQNASILAKIEKTQASLKMPLDAVDPKIFPRLVELVTNVKNSDGTLAFIKNGNTAIKAMLSEQEQILISLKQKISSLRTAIISLRMRPLLEPKNDGIIRPSLATLIGTPDNKIAGVIDNLVAEFNGITKKVNEIAEQSMKYLKRGVPEEDINALKEGETKLSGIIDLLKGSIDQLASVFDSRATCSWSKPASPVPGQIPISEAQCGSGPVKLVALLLN